MGAAAVHGAEKRWKFSLRRLHVEERTAFGPPVCGPGRCSATVEEWDRRRGDRAGHGHSQAAQMSSRSGRFRDGTRG